jgi:16S rRNA (guanine527-N7)-methyltransferase
LFHVKHPETTPPESPPPLLPHVLLDHPGVTPDVLDRLTVYLGLLAEWRERINLVGRSTLADPWRRHILDSVQLFPLLPPGTDTLFDLGSGAGFPGLVLALLTDGKTVPFVKLIESDSRKCGFLRHVIAATGARATVINARAEQLPARPAAVITARAVAPLPRLLDFARPLIGKSTVCLFLKGAAVERELTESARSWHMQVMRVASLSDPAGTVLKLQGIARRDRR